jgi:hypothetical protein
MQEENGFEIPEEVMKSLMRSKTILKLLQNNNSDSVNSKKKVEKVVRQTLSLAIELAQMKPVLGDVKEDNEFKRNALRIIVPSCLCGMRLQEELIDVIWRKAREYKISSGA